MSPAAGISGKRVVVTRAEVQGGPLATAIALAGAEPVSLPLLGIEPVDFDSPDATTIEAFDAIVFTSANAVDCFIPRLSGDALAALRLHARIAVVGPATGRAVERIGANVAITAPEHVAESLSRSMGDVTGLRVLWPRAEAARRVLAESLAAAGADVTELVIYRTAACVPDDARMRIRGADAVTFTSPSGVDAWASALGKPEMRVICIGPVTARAAAAHGFRVDSMANPYTIEGIVSAVKHAFAGSGDVPA